ncbi:MAG: hypothetical protein R3327_02525 [Nitrosopumilaceae archaeon]|nr:hypothetical protein [Nitrosopumilaceae archaeon]
MDSCDTRVHAYKNGRTFDDCRKIAQSMNPDFKKQIDTTGKMLWTDILEKVDFDAVVYKLTLKYLRQAGYDIGNSKRPVVTKVN